MFKKIYYFILRKYCDWTNDYNDFPGHHLAKDIKWVLQKLFRGYNDLDLWNLDNHFAKLILKRLKAFKKMDRNCYPPPEDPKCTEIENADDWEKVLDDMIEGFEVYIIVSDGDYEFSIEKCNQLQQKVNRGLYLFEKYFGYLGD